MRANPTHSRGHIALVGMILAIALVATACGGGDDTDSSASDADSSAATPTAPAPTEEPTTAPDSASTRDLSDTYEAFGNPDADIVLVNTQGGPSTEFFIDDLRELTSIAGVDLDEVYVVNVHQVQTLDPDAYLNEDLDFETIKERDTESVQMLADVVNHFKADDREVYVLGISFGAFMAQDLLATHGVTADGYLIMVGRLDMPDEVWTEFAEGRTAGFVDGVDVIAVPIEDAGMGAGTEAGDRNMARLAAGLGHKRYTELLADTDLSTVRYVYGETDEQVGRLSAAEIAFLEAQGAEVISDPGGHGPATDLHIADGLAWLLGDDVAGAGDIADDTTDTAGDIAIPDTTAPTGDALLTHSFAGSIVTSTGTDAAIVESGIETDLDLGLPSGTVAGLPGAAVFAATADDSILIVPFDAGSQEPVGSIAWLTASGELFAGDDVEISETAEGYLTVRGTVSDAVGSADDIDIAAAIGFGVGSSTFELDGDRAIVRGTLGAATFDQMQHLIDAHPEVTTLVLQNVPGSENDEVNVQTARLVREARYTTYVPADGLIASGGVDLFAAGVERIAEPGAEVGVHAWCCGPEGESAHLIDQDDPAHDHQTSYFGEIMGEEAGLRFYFFTLQAATFENIENMTPAEMDAFDLVTANDVLEPTVNVGAAAFAGQTFDTAQAAADAVAEWRFAGGEHEILVVLDGPVDGAVMSSATEFVFVDFTEAADGTFTITGIDTQALAA